MLSVLEVIRKTSEFFAGRGIESPRLNAELLVSHVLGLPRMALYLQFERPVSEPELSAVRELVRRRGRREPLQYVLGFVEFRGLRLKTDARALIPRPETEFLVETIVARLGGSPPGPILDLGTGTGALALALASVYPGSRVTAVDASPEALALARENVEASGLSDRVELRPSDWFSAVADGEAFGLIVANPPYLSEEELAAAAPEVRDFEPGRALAAAEGGFRDIAAIISGARARLLPGGLLALETGVAHHPRAREAAQRAGFSRVESLPDLAGRDRFFLAWP